MIGRIWLHGSIVCLQGIGFAAIGAFFALYFLHRNWSYAGLGLTAFGSGFVPVRVLFGHLPGRTGGPHAMVRLIARVIGVGIETADMLVNEILTRGLRDRKAVARYAGLRGAPDESGQRRREKGLARAGNARVRRGMIQLAWRFLRFQQDSALAQWFSTRTRDGGGTTRKRIGRGTGA